MPAAMGKSKLGYSFFTPARARLKVRWHFPGKLALAG
jgi:hypothetical protein